MGINFDGVNPESKAKFEQILQDGIITVDEVKSLSPEEQQDLSRLLGGVELPKEGEIKLFSEPPETPQKPGLFKRVTNWFKDKDVPTGKKVLAGLGTVAAAAATVAGVCYAPALVAKLATSAIASHPGAAAAVAGLAGVGVLASSCGKLEDPTTININNEHNNYIGVNIKIDVDENTDYNQLIEAVQNAVNEIKANQDKNTEEMNKKLDGILQAIIKNGVSLDNIIRLINDGYIKSENMFNIILKAIEDGKAVTADGLETLKELIMENNKIAQGTQDAVNNMQIKLGEDHAEILKALKNGNLQLDQVITLLNAIDVKETDQTVALNIIGTTLNAIYDKIKGVEGYSEEFKTLLLKILAKIPDACKCNPKNLQVIIDKLNEILDAIKKEPEGNHEGILTDLDKYFQ